MSSYFFPKQTNIKKIDLTILKKTKKNFKRICLHDSLNDTNQEMIIYQKKLIFYPPKKYTTSDQTFFIIKGKLIIIIFDSRGKILEKFLLDKNNLLCRVKKGIYHCDIPLTEDTIHFESNNHSFKKRKVIFLQSKYLKSLNKFIDKLKNGKKKSINNRGK